MKKTLQQLLSFTLTILIASVSFGQFVKDLKRSADNFYAKGDYFSAAEYYEQYLQQKEKKSGPTTQPYTVQKSGKSSKAETNATSYQDIVYSIGESHRQLRNFAKAEKWYGEASGFDKTAFPLAQYWYGVSLRANGKFAEAEKALQSFISSYSPNDQNKEQAKIELADVQFIQQQMKKADAKLYSVVSMPLNGEGANYAPSWNSNSFIFTSTRADSSALTKKNKNPYVNNLYWSSMTDGGLAQAEKIKLNVSDEMEQGAATFTAEGNKMYFTRWVKKDGQNLAAIYVSEKQNSEWSAPVLAGGRVNMEGHSSKQPYITADGKYLLFSSNRPGGSGKYDLYYSTLNNGTPGAVSNFGNTINTKNDDEAPFYHQRTNTLVISSNGRVGMGGYDLYETKGALGSSAWESPKNLGYPVNSIKDDIYFANKGSDQLLKEAIISSDRGSECCLQLYTVNKIYKKYVAGIVTDCKTNQPIDAAKISVTDASNNTTIVASQLTNNGNYFFELNAFAPMTISASKESYNNGQIQVPVPNNILTDTLQNLVVCLMPVEVKVEPQPEPEPEKPKELKAFFDFAKYDLREETGVLLDTLVSLLKRETKLGLEIHGYTDERGTSAYNLNLSRQRAEACKAYLVKNGIAASRLRIFTYGEEKSTKANDEAILQQDRKVEFKIVLLRL